MTHTTRKFALSPPLPQPSARRSMTPDDRAAPHPRHFEKSTDAAG
jgi:hypothetical protein